MKSDSASSRRYSDEEVHQLLKRASELESQATNLPALSEGPTLQDLEAIAAEAGINPVALRQAARELESVPPADTGSSTLSTAFLGSPLSVELERVVPGEVPDSVLESLIPALQRASDGMGQPSLLGRTLTWQSTNPQSARALQVTARVGGGGTHLLIEERYGNLAGGLFGGLMGGGGGGIGLGVGLGVGLGALGSVFFATVFPAAIIGGSYLLSRGIYRSFVQKRSKILRRLMEEMIIIIEDGQKSMEIEGPSPEMKELPPGSLRSE